MSGNDCWNEYVLSLWQKLAREADDWITEGKLFSATGNERRVTVARRYAGSCSRCDEDKTNYLQCKTGTQRPPVLTRSGTSPAHSRHFAPNAVASNTVALPGICDRRCVSSFRFDSGRQIFLRTGLNDSQIRYIKVSVFSWQGCIRSLRAFYVYATAQISYLFTHL